MTNWRWFIVALSAQLGTCDVLSMLGLDPKAGLIDPSFHVVPQKAMLSATGEEAVSTVFGHRAVAGEFQSLDLNGDGMISLREFGSNAAKQIRNNASDSDVSKLFDSEDSDHSGALSMAEYRDYALAAMQSSGNESTIDWFLSVDVDGDGIISKKEFLDVMADYASAKTMNLIGANFADVDKDSDAKIEQEEFRIYVSGESKLISMGPTDYFTLLDKDSDDSISFAEFTAMQLDPSSLDEEGAQAYKSVQSALAEAFGNDDKDADGSLTLAEYQTAFESASASSGQPGQTADAAAGQAGQTDNNNTAGTAPAGPHHEMGTTELWFTLDGLTSDAAAKLMADQDATNDINDVLVAAGAMPENSLNLELSKLQDEVVVHITITVDETANPGFDSDACAEAMNAQSTADMVGKVYMTHGYILTVGPTSDSAPEAAPDPSTVVDPQNATDSDSDSSFIQARQVRLRGS